MQNGVCFVEHSLLCDQIYRVVFLVYLVQFELDSCEISGNHDLEGLWAEILGIVKFLSLHFISCHLGLYIFYLSYVKVIYLEFGINR